MVHGDYRNSLYNTGILPGIHPGKFKAAHTHALFCCIIWMEFKRPCCYMQKERLSYSASFQNHHCSPLDNSHSTCPIRYILLAFCRLYNNLLCIHSLYDPFQQGDYCGFFLRRVQPTGFFRSVFCRKLCS